MASAAAVELEEPVEPLRRNRDFRALWLSQFISTAGTNASGIAYPLLVLSISGSAAEAGIVGFCASIPFPFCFPLAGVIVDRFPRRRLMIGAEIGRGIALGSIPLAAAFGVLGVPQLGVAAFVEGALFALFTTSENAAIPRVVAKSQVPLAVASNQAREQAATVVGGPLGGLLFSVARTAPFLCDAISYVFSLVLLFTVRAELEEEREPRPFTLFADLREGLRFIWRDAFMRTSTAIATVGNFVLGGFALAVIVRAQALSASPRMIGIILGLFGIGGVLGAKLAVRLVTTKSIGIVIVIPLWIWTVFALAIPAVGSPLLIGVAAAGTGASVVIFNVAARTYRYAHTPDALIGRIMSVGRMVSFATLPLGAAAAGVFIQLAGSRIDLLATAALVGLAAIAATGSSAIRQARV